MRAKHYLQMENFLYSLQGRNTFKKEH